MMHGKSKFSGWKLCADSPLYVDGLYSVSDSAYNTMFLVTSVGVIAMDARPS
jgi:hypothetical protein